MGDMNSVSPIVANLTSEDIYLIGGRGVVHIVRNPRDTHSDENWRWLINHRVRLDGYLAEVLSVESYCIHGLYSAGRPIGIIIREVDEEEPVI